MRATALLPTGMLVAFVIASAPARADDDPAVDAAAQALYDEGTAAMDRGDHAAACPKLEEVVRLKPAGIGAKLTVAECYEGAGRLASAWAAYGKAESAAAKAGQSARQEKAAKHVADLAKRVATLEVVVPAAVRAVPGLEVRADGIVLGEAAFGVAVPVDRGKHVVRAIAPGRGEWQSAIEAVDGRPSRVVVALAAPPPPPPDVPEARSWTLPAVTLGTSVAGFAVAGVSAAQIAHERSIADAECDATKQCSDAGLSAVRTARTLDVVGAVGFGVGVAGLAGFGAWLLWPTLRRDRPPAVVAPTVGGGGAGIAVGGTF